MSRHDSKKTPHHTSDHHIKKVFDVRRPGKSPASPTSRPVITGHVAPVHDAQFVSGAPLLRAADDATEKPELLDGKERRQITPVSEPPTDTVPSPEAVIETDIEPAAGAREFENTEEPVVADNQPVADESPFAPQPVLDTATSQSALPEPVPPAGYVDDATKETPQPEANEAGQQPVHQNPDNSTGEVAAPSPEARQEPAPPTEDPTPESLGLGLDRSSTSETGSPPAGQNMTPNTGANASDTKSIQQLLSESDTPVLEPDHSPGLIISHHRSHASSKAKTLLGIALILVFVLLLLNILLDLGVLDLGLPHTNLLGS